MIRDVLNPANLLAVHVKSDSLAQFQTDTVTTSTPVTEAVVFFLPLDWTATTTCCEHRTPSLLLLPLSPYSFFYTQPLLLLWLCFKSGPVERIYAVCRVCRVCRPQREWRLVAGKVAEENRHNRTRRWTVQLPRTPRGRSVFHRSASLVVSRKWRREDRSF